MSPRNKLGDIFASDLGALMVISYVVLGNNAVTNRYIERTWGMPVQAWSALFAIVTFPGIRAKEIRHLFPRPQNTISRAIALLEARGHVESRVSATDGREKRLYATAEGEEVLAEIRAASLGRQDEIFAPLTPDERETFFRLARRIADCPALRNSRVMPGPEDEADR